MQRENYERFVHGDFPSDANEEDDHAQATPYMHPFEDGGYDKEMMLTWNDWDRMISRFGQDRGWGEGQDYDLSEEECNGDGIAVGHAEMTPAT